MMGESFDLIGFIKNRKEEKVRLQSELANMNADFGDKSGDIKKILDGGIVLDGSVLTVLANSIMSFDNASVIGLLQSINEKSRESAYAFYKHADDKMIESDQMQCVAMYTQLKKQGDEARAYFEEHGWNHDLYNNDLDIMMIRNYGTNKNIVGVKERPTLDEIGFDPTSFDILYDIAKQILTKDKTQNRRVFSEADRSVKGRIASLKAMSPSQYRNFKLAQMCLTEDEKVLFKKHIAEFGKEEEKRVEL